MSVLKTVARNYLEKPQLITPTAFQEIAELLDMKGGRAALQEYFKPLPKEESLKLKMNDPFYTGYRFSDDGEVEEYPESYGIIKIEGALTYKQETQMCAPETCNYQDLVKQMENLASLGKKKVFMIHDSCGGEAYSMMSSAKQARKIADDNGIELVGYVDGLSASASYGWLSICDKIIASGDSTVGSIGVVISLINNSEALKKEGFKRKFITAGSSKVPFDEEGEFKSEFIEKLQDDVNELYDNFVNHVASYRTNMSVKEIKDTEAKTFRANQAMKLGLIDEVMEVSEFKEKYLNGDNQENSPSTKNPTDNKRVSMSVEKNISLESFEALKKELSEYKAKEEARQLETKKQAITESLSSATFLSDFDNVVSNLMNADETQASLIKNVISDASTALDKQKTELTELFNSEKEQLTSKVESLETANTKLAQEKEDIKKEFSKPSAVRGEERQENLESLSHKEKMARAVELAKTKKQNK